MPIYPSNRLDFALRSYTRFADGYALLSGDNHAYAHTLAGQSATFLEGKLLDTSTYSVTLAIAV